MRWQIKLVYFSRTWLAARSWPATTIIGLAYTRRNRILYATKVNVAARKTLVGGIRRALCAYNLTAAKLGSQIRASVRQRDPICRWGSY